MAIADKIKNICVKLGENNKPTYAVMAIATVKGIARPAFTMMDKTEDAETKKYTALREGLTEVVAIPAYWGCGELAGKIAQNLNLPQSKKSLAQHNLMFIGVCTAALFVIPALASVAIKPFMNKIQKKSGQKQGLDIKENSVDETVRPVNKVMTKPSYAQATPYFRVNMASMKVGG